MREVKSLFTRNPWSSWAKRRPYSQRRTSNICLMPTRLCVVSQSATRVSIAVTTHGLAATHASNRCWIVRSGS